MKYSFKKEIFGKEAEELAKIVGLADKFEGDSTDYNTKVTFTCDDREGHPCILVEFEIP